MTGLTVRVKTLDIPGRPVEFTDKDIADCTNDELAACFMQIAARGHFNQLAAWCTFLAVFVRDKAKQQEQAITTAYPSHDSPPVYIPSEETKPDEEPSIEYVREHGVIPVGRDGQGERTAVAQVRWGRKLLFCAVTMNDDGTIKDFAPQTVNRYVRYDPNAKPEESCPS